MAGYIGTVPVPQATETRDVYTATSSQTTFATGGYTPNFVSVYLNGVHLARADYTASNGTDVVLAVGAAADDTVEIVSFNTFEVSAQTFTGDVTTTGTFLATGDTAAGDDAAVGYAAADGLVLTGQGTTSDVTIKNDADATVMSILTGTTGATFAGDVIVPDGDLILGSTAVTSTAAELNQLDGVVAKTAGKDSIWIPAAAMYPSTTNPCSDLTQVETTALRPDLKVLDFAAAADDFAQFAIAFPKSWNLGTITYQPFWTVTAGTNTGTVVWQLGGIAVTSDDTINTAFGTLIATTALAHSGTSNDLMVSAESGAVTIAGSPADNDQCFFQINNDASASGQTGVVRLLGVKLFFTTDAANDA